jgi:hypothetical protein
VQVPPTYQGTLAPQLNPTCSGWLLPGRPTFSGQPERARVQVPPTYQETLAPQLYPTSSGWLLPGWPTFSGQPGRERVQVEMEQQVQEAEMVMQLVEEILQPSVIFQPEPVGVLCSRTPGYECLSNANDDWSLRSAHGTRGTSPLAWRQSHHTMGGRLACLGLAFKE